MYNLSKEKAEKILSSPNTGKPTVEKHYIFGRNGIFSFAEDKNIFSVIVSSDYTYVMNEYVEAGSVQHSVSETDSKQAVRFLKKIGYSPFMRFDITRYELEEHVIERVDQLGYFTDHPDKGGEEVNYGEALKRELLKDKEKERDVKKQAREILQET